MVVVTASLLVWVVNLRYFRSPRPPIPVSLPTASLTFSGAVVEGSPTAPIGVLIFTGYRCSACRELILNELPDLRERFIVPGKVRLALRQMALTQPRADEFVIAQGLACAEAQGKFWEMQRAMFNGRLGILGDDKAPGTLVADLEKLAGTVPLEPSLYRECVRGEVDQKVFANAGYGIATGVAILPTVFIGSFVAEDSLKVSARLEGSDSVTKLADVVSALINHSPGGK